MDLKDVKVVDIASKVDPDAKPPKALSTFLLNRKLPMTFHNLPAQKHRNKFPYDQTYLTSLYVASKHRGLETNDVDFVLGGSTLDVLANCHIPNDTTYLAVGVPGTKIVLVAKHKEYMQNYSDPGFQFERFVAGKRFEDKHDTSIVEHMHLVEVAGHNIFFTAESDAVDEQGNAIEIRASNPRHWGTRIGFQMISNGACSLYAGTKLRRTMLKNVQLQRLETVIGTALHNRDVSELEENIASNLDALREAIKSGRFADGTVYEVRFSGYDLQLIPSEYKEGEVLLPRAEVVKKMLGFSDDE